MNTEELVEEFCCKAESFSFGMTWLLKGRLISFLFLIFFVVLAVFKKDVDGWPD